MTKIPVHNLYEPKPGQSIVKSDFQTIEWGREANSSWKIGISSNPAFFTADGHNVRLEDSARGASVLITDRSIDADIDLNSVHIWGVNKAIETIPCKIWTPTSDVQNYDMKYWNNQAILKLLPLQVARTKRKDGKFISHSPNCFYYRRHTSFNAAFFLQEETIWSDNTNGSEIVTALKISIMLGYRNIFINTNINHESKPFQHLQQIASLLPPSISITNCGNLNMFQSCDISEACSSCILP